MQLGLILLIYFTDRSRRSSSNASATAIDGSGPPAPEPHGAEPPPIAARSRWSRCRTCDSPVNDVEDSDTSKRADSGCSSAAGGRGEAGHPAHDPWCPPGDRLYGAIGAAHRGPTVGGRH
jgi:hypothetical protein